MLDEWAHRPLIDFGQVKQVPTKAEAYPGQGHARPRAAGTSCAEEPTASLRDLEPLAKELGDELGRALRGRGALRLEGPAAVSMWLFDDRVGALARWF